MYLQFIEFATPGFDEAVSLRNDILCTPLNIEFDPEDIKTEWDSHHLACYSDANELLGCLTLKPLPKGELKMRQVAVKEDHQVQGIGKALVKESEYFCQINSFNKIVLNARKTAVPFYKKLGYKTQGKMFLEVGIEHYSMTKTIPKK